MEEQGQKLITEQENAKIDYQKLADELYELDVNKTEAISHLNYEKELDRNTELSDIPVEKYEPLTDKQKADAIKNAKDEDEIEAIENGEVINIERVSLNDDTIKKTVDTTLAVENMDHIKQEESLAEFHNEVENKIVEIHENKNNIAQVMATVFDWSNQQKLARIMPDPKNKSDDLDMDDKEDDFTRNMNQVSSYHDFILKSIADLPSFIKSVLDTTKDVNLTDVAGLDKHLKGRLKEIVDEKISLMHFDESEESQNAKNAAL